jgi:DNA phosphorothioation-associated putative methyltransferase
MTPLVTVSDSLQALIEQALEAGLLASPPQTWTELLQQLPHTTLVHACQESDIGKTLPSAFYVHCSAVAALPLPLRLYEGYAASGVENLDNATLVKFSLSQPQLSYLSYPDFDADPHPALVQSILVNLRQGTVSCRNYQDSKNPPILHRKETFVEPSYPGYEQFRTLTQQEEALGLLDNTRHIGTRNNWQRYLRDVGVEIQGHQVQRRSVQNPIKSRIARHRAAMMRHDLSRPLKLALEAGLLTPEMTCFDYGCGYGGDVKRLQQRGLTAQGWDPYYAPETALEKAQFVNLGYVINVIEDPQERREALQKAWALTEGVLLVAAQVLVRDRDEEDVVYGDGVVTQRGTFQKYYEQEELKAYIDGVLAVDALPVGLGVYGVFRDREQQEQFRASRFRSRSQTPRVRVSVQRFEECRDTLEPLMQFFSDRGRLPKPTELIEEADIIDLFGSLRRAFRLVLQATDEADWDAIAERRRQELLIYLALTALGDRPRFSELTPAIRYDIRAFFGNYKQALMAADLMLYGLGSLERLGKLCDRSDIGQRSPRGLTVHISAFNHLDPILRLYEGCASHTIGRMDDTTLIQFHTQRPKISYFHCPDFDTNPHPLIKTIMQIDLQDLRVHRYTYDLFENPFVLHKKEDFVTPDYPHYDRFARLSRQEQKWGLLDDLEAIRRYRQWLKCLKANGAEVRGHRVYWRKDVDPYQKRIIEARKNRSKS